MLRKIPGGEISQLQGQPCIYSRFTAYNYTVDVVC